MCIYRQIFHIREKYNQARLKTATTIKPPRFLKDKY